jgi:hypothetical protein
MGGVCGQAVLILATASGDRVWLWQAGNRGCKVSSESVDRGRGSLVSPARQQCTSCLCCVRSGWGLGHSECVHGAVVRVC